MTYDIQHLLNYQFKNSSGLIRTCNLEVVYNKFKNKSDINAIYYNSFNQWSKSFQNKIGYLIKHPDKENDIFVKCLRRFILDIYHLFRYSHGSVSNSELAKEDIATVIKKYHSSFDNYPEYMPPLIDSSKVPMPVIQREIKMLYYSYIERIPYLTYKKGHRGLVRDYDYIPHYSGSVPDLLPVNE